MRRIGRQRPAIPAPRSGRRSRAIIRTIDRGDPVTAPTLQAAGAAPRPVPDIVTALPGPKARAHIEFDHAWTSPSLPRAYPIVPVRGEGCTIEDIDGNLFLDFTAGIAVNSTGHAHPRVTAAIARRPS
jgi:4-aminobutyrate aminotransferase